MAPKLTHLALLLELYLGFCGCARPQAPPMPATDVPGIQVVAEERSSFSHFRITDSGTSRTLWFIRDSGEEVLESQVDRRVPHHLLVPYTQTMFASLLFQPNPRRALLVGLGGGAMVHFVQAHQRELKLDVVEIDPAIVKAARMHFAVSDGPNTHIITQDAFDFLARAGRYDVIYMDAFLKPAANTDSTGVALRMKTVDFLRQQVLGHLEPTGVAVFNLNWHPALMNDIEALLIAFPQLYVFRVPHSQNYVVVGSSSQERVLRKALKPAGAALDAKLDAGFSFEAMGDQLVVDEPQKPEPAQAEPAAP